LIANELGVSLVPELTLFQFRDPDLVAIPVYEPELVRPILIVKRKRDADMLALSRLFEIVFTS
jgi:LysR family carnitine catabolism transcriptional activator